MFGVGWVGAMHVPRVHMCAGGAGECREARAPHMSALSIYTYIKPGCPMACGPYQVNGDMISACTLCTADNGVMNLFWYARDQLCAVPVTTRQHAQAGLRQHFGTLHRSYKLLSGLPSRSLPGSTVAPCRYQFGAIACKNRISQSRAVITCNHMIRWSTRTAS